MNSIAALYEKSRVPLYLQVAQLMRQRIEAQAWRVGEQIPTLDELEKEYQVSRITLRAALDQLEELGIVKRTRGLGTFVAKDLSKERWFKLPTSLDELVEAVEELKIRPLPVEGRAPWTLTPRFDFGVPAAAYQRLRSVHHRDDDPYCLIDLYLEKTLYDSDPGGFRNRTVVPQLVRRRGLRLAGARQVMRVTTATELTARHLDIGVGDAIAYVSRAIVDHNQRILYYAEIQYPGQMFEIEMDLLRPQVPRQPSRSNGARR